MNTHLSAELHKWPLCSWGQEPTYTLGIIPILKALKFGTPNIILAL
jgi:hypothetical protein